MRGMGIILVLLAGLSAYGLERKSEIEKAIALVADATSEEIVAAESGTLEEAADPSADAVRSGSDRQATDVSRSAAGTATVPDDRTEMRDKPSAHATGAGVGTEASIPTPLYVPPIVTPNPALATGGAAVTTPGNGAAPSATEVAARQAAALSTQPPSSAASAVVAALPSPPSPKPADGGMQLPPYAGPTDKRVAKVAFGAVKTAAPLAARAIGFYSRGCLSGGKMLPVDGPAWQAMRLSRNRNWGHPDLVRYVERLAADVRAHDGWPGLLVGDLSQPRGGPMLTGHASHQIGLDADIWFTPMPDRRMTTREREELAATDMLGPSKLTVDPAVWTTAHVAVIKRATSYKEVERILVHPAIKKALCDAAGPSREWLHKVRPYWGHHYHFHVRLACPAGNSACSGQKPPPSDDGCGKELDDWFKLLTAPPKPEPPPSATPAPPPRPLMIEQLPAECRQVLQAKETWVRRIFRSRAADKGEPAAPSAPLAETAPELKVDGEAPGRR